MNISYPFIRRPIGTTLLAVGLFLAGSVAYVFLPVASLPAVELPTISVTATRPGADPETMAATIAAPLERRLGEIAGITEMTSRSSLGSTRITIQFDLSRDIDGAARDVQAALNSALSDLPGDLPNLPSFRKFNPSATPVMILAMTSKSIPASAMYDIADTVLAQRISQTDGVGDVTVSGAEQPAIRVQMNPSALAMAGISMEQVRTAISNANSLGPVGAFDGGKQTAAIATNKQLEDPQDYGKLVVKTSNGDVVRLSNIATVERGVRNSRSASWFNGQPSVLLIITKDSTSNVVETVQRIRDLLPEMKRWIPADIDISILSDRSLTIKAGIEHMQSALLATVILVMLVVFVFLRRTAATIAAGVTIPLALAGTCGAMWIIGFSINNVSLMALVVSVGFVVDDSIVMIENMFRNLERGMSPIRAALQGARQIGFTVISISISLIAAFIPMLFMGGIVGRFFREFSVTLTFAILISTAVSLSVTPMICAYFVRSPPSKTRTWLDRVVEAALGSMIRGYSRSLEYVLHRSGLVLLVFVAIIGLTARLYVTTPKSAFPRDDTGLIFGGTRASPDISFPAMAELQQKAMAIVSADPAVAGVGSSISSSGGFNASVNRGSLYISLKPLDERGVSAETVAQRLRIALRNIPGVQTYVFPLQELRTGGRSSDSSNQYTIWDPEIAELNQWVPKVVERLKKVPEITEVNTDRDVSGLQANVIIDRMAASRLGVNIADIDTALNNAFSQRQISTIYNERNQYRVILEVDPNFQRDPGDLTKIYVPGKDAQVPLSALARLERGIAPLTVNHQGQYPAVTVSFELAPDVVFEVAANAIDQAVAELHMPGTVHTEFAGDARTARTGSAGQPMLLLAALIAVYIVLGVLYESLLHPLTIISTLPPAGLGALMALQLFGVELTLIAFIGIILLIGLVKKNGIMLVDFALDGERNRGLTPERAIVEACIARFRPILMTTLSAMLGALPLMLATGPGSEVRRPLGMTIIGGLLVSQFLTLYTTPVIYLMLDRLRLRWMGRRNLPTILPGAVPAAPGKLR